MIEPTTMILSASRVSRRPDQRPPGHDDAAGISRRVIVARRVELLERTITVQGNESRGIDTGVEVRAGDQITMSASGSIVAGQRVGTVGPDGARSGASAIFGVSRRPVPTAGVGALIGYLMQPGGGTTTQPFLVGSQLVFTAQTDGRLYLLVNDDNYNDNSGGFTVRILYPDNR